MLDPTRHPRLLLSLEAASCAHPCDRKLLVCRRPAEGRELLRALAMAGVAWVGWETTTLRAIASEAAAAGLAAEGLSPADEFDVLAAADEAIDAVVRREDAGAARDVPGARAAIHGAVATLRRAGIEAAGLRRARPGSPSFAALAATLEAYAGALRRMRRDDDAGVARRAVDALASGATALPDARIHLVPGLPLRGVAGHLVRLLIDRGAEVLETDPVMGVGPPPGTLWRASARAASPLSAIHLPPCAPTTSKEAGEVEMFAAATAADEVREVLRRVLASGTPWDRVEIVAPDPELYGGALASLAARLEAVDGTGVPATLAEGVALGRTRAGRALAAYFRWIGGGFPAAVPRRLLDQGDLAPPPSHARRVSARALAARLRGLRIGWGAERYLPAIDAARRALDYSPEELIVAAGPGLGAGGAGPGAARADEELDALRSLLEPILAAAPPGPDRAGGALRTSPAALAVGALAFLEHVPSPTPAERVARAVLAGRLRRARETLTRETTWDAAVSILRARLETRVAPSGDGGPPPWTSCGGRLHLSGPATGGLCCRAVTFVVGLDASAGAADAGGDALLTEADRRLFNRLSADPVPPLAAAADRAAEARHARAALLARLRGQVTLSYAAWDPAEGRAASPAPELLQVLRHREGRGDRGYEHLRAALGPLACAVPRGVRLLDGPDAWLAALAGHGRMRDGSRAVRAAHPGLDRGLAAARARAGAQATAYHGVVTPRGEARLPEAFSASALEALGACPRRYFYRYVLGLEPGEDRARDPARWLTPAQRGSLLHRVYERTLREARLEGHHPASPAFMARAFEALDDEAERASVRISPPAPALRDAEEAELRRDLRCWVEMVREAPPRWIHVEYRFGPGHGEVSVGERPVALRGMIDRVDEAAPGRLCVVDYKTRPAGPVSPRPPPGRRAAGAALGLRGGRRSAAGRGGGSGRVPLSHPRRPQRARAPPRPPRRGGRGAAGADGGAGGERPLPRHRRRGGLHLLRLRRGVPGGAGGARRRSQPAGGVDEADRDPPSPGPRAEGAARAGWVTGCRPTRRRARGSRATWRRACWWRPAPARGRPPRWWGGWWRWYAAAPARWTSSPPSPSPARPRASCASASRRRWSSPSASRPGRRPPSASAWKARSATWTVPSSAPSTPSAVACCASGRSRPAWRPGSARSRARTRSAPSRKPGPASWSTWTRAVRVSRRRWPVSGSGPHSCAGWSARWPASRTCASRRPPPRAPTRRARPPCARSWRRCSTRRSRCFRPSGRPQGGTRCNPGSWRSASRAASPGGTTRPDFTTRSRPPCCAAPTSS
jgi:hypothetical protein